MEKRSVIGGAEEQACTVLAMDAETVHKTNIRFWDAIGSEFLGVTALPQYGAFLTEERLRLLGDISNKKLLEIGCGDGRSLKYVSDRGASELWGLDISPAQIERAREFLRAQGIDAKLLCAPMESECGLPEQYFDMVYSVYAIGWTTDLNRTFGKISACLKKGGIFIFSWSHPIHKCVSLSNGRLLFCNSYFDEAWYTVSLGEQEIMLSNRKLSTYINALAANGFAIEQMVEETDENMLPAEETDFSRKARMLPVTFVIKARKL